MCNSLHTRPATTLSTPHHTTQQPSAHELKHNTGPQTTQTNNTINPSTPTHSTIQHHNTTHSTTHSPSSHNPPARLFRLCMSAFVITPHCSFDQRLQPLVSAVLTALYYVLPSYHVVVCKCVSVNSCDTCTIRPPSQWWRHERKPRRCLQHLSSLRTCSHCDLPKHPAQHPVRARAENPQLISSQHLQRATPHQRAATSHLMVEKHRAATPHMMMDKHRADTPHLMMELHLQ